MELREVDTEEVRGLAELGSPDRFVASIYLAIDLDDVGRIAALLRY